MTTHNKTTIVSMAVVTTVVCSLLHEGLGHGVTAWLRGDIVTQLTSNHLSSVRPDRLVDAGGTLVNLIVGTLCLLAAPRLRNANSRYFLWFLGACNLLQGSGYFLFSGVLNLGDWADLIVGLPRPVALRIAMAATGAVLYVLSVRWIGTVVHPYVPRRGVYNTAGRLPYLAACCFDCLAGAFDPLGLRLMLLSTIPAAFGGLSGLLWADSLMPRTAPAQELTVRRSPGWWVAAVALGVVFLLTVARGIEFHRG